MWRMAIVGFLALTMIGCQFIGVIAPIISVGVFWMNREAHKYYNTDMEKMEASVRQVLEDLKMPIQSDTKSDGILTLKCDVDDRFTITVNPVRDNVTKVSILVNTLGDKAYAEMIYRHIDDQDGVVQFVTIEELNCAMEDSPRRR